MLILYESASLLAVGKTEFVRVEAGAGGGESLEGMARDFLAQRAAQEPASPLGEGSLAAEEARPFLGLVHRIDQPVTGVVLFAKTKAALSHLNGEFSSRRAKKLYWAVTISPPPEERGSLSHFIVFDSKKNKARAFEKERPGAKAALLHYRLMGKSDRYFFVEVELVTGRPHQIRAQFAAAGCPVKGDLKYGSPRSNPGGGIHLHARELSFREPEGGKALTVTASPPADVLWNMFSSCTTLEG
ncbi:MAG: RNA pseudouridine synthase [Spirochaetales bacterium]|nr:RNA pseudouridine synthase [Spirochaetales bacterium]